jgi:hypothetical protein
LRKVMRFYEIDKNDYDRLKIHHECPARLIGEAILNLDVKSIISAPEETVKLRLYLTKEQFKALDRKAKSASVSSASVIRSIARTLASLSMQAL